MSKVLLFLIQLTLGIALPRWIVRRDLARLDPTRSARAWNDASFWMSVVVFGPLCLPFHFVKTRRSLLGGLLGFAWMAGAFAVIGLAAALIATLLGVD